MIKELRLQNFQSHKDTVLEFHPGVNVVAGSSNSGKSTVLRAINWLLYNRPSGDAFVSHWARNAKGNQELDTSVTMITDRVTIERKKSKTTKNTYSIDDKMLEAIGLDIPEEVSSALNMGEVNTQRQHDAPFLLSESPGEVARFFNKIVHFDAIDQYLSALESKKRKAKSEAENAKQNAERLEKELEQYSFIKKSEQILNKIEVAEDTLNDIKRNVNVLGTDLGIYGENYERYESASAIISKAEKLVAHLEKAQEGLPQKREVIKALTESLVASEYSNDVLTKTKDLALAEKYCKKISAATTLSAQLGIRVKVLQESITQYEDMMIMDGCLKEEIINEESALPDTCPLCGKELEWDS